MMAEGYFLARHAERKSGASQTPGISEQGLGEVRQNAKELVNLVQSSPEGSVFFLGACSEHQRTDATALAYVEEVRKAFQDSREVVVYVPESVRAWQVRKAGARMAHMSTLVPYNKVPPEIIASCPVSHENLSEEIRKVLRDFIEKRVVVGLPLYVRDFSFFRHGWIDRKTYDFVEPARSWLKEDEELPDQVANFNFVNRWLEARNGLPEPSVCVAEIEKGINRYESFVKALSGSRPLYVGAFNHAWELEAYLLNQLNAGITPEKFREVFKGKALHTAEPFTITGAGGTRRIEFRGESLEANK